MTSSRAEGRERPVKKKRLTKGGKQMAVVPKTEMGDWPRVPESGFFDAVIRNPVDNPAGKFGPETKFEVDLGMVETVEHGVAQVKLIDYCSQKYSGGEKSSKLWKIAQACGFDVENIEEFDTEWLDGKKCRVLVEAGPSTKGPGTHNSVKSYSPRKSSAANGLAAAGQPARKASPPTTDDDDTLPF